MAQRWTRTHERQREAILAALIREARPFADMGDDARAERRALPFLDWCRTYLPHYFTAPFAPFHRRMVEAVGEPAMPTFIGAFRGAGKSAFLSLARPLHRALGGEIPFAIYGSQVQRLAAQNMDYVRLELEHNPRIRSDYGQVTVSGPEDDWVVELRHAEGMAFRSCKFEAFGIGMSPRGRRHGAHRPLEFIGDDLENSELARNPRREAQLWEWLTGDVIPALEPDRWALTVMGTMFGADCLLEHARKEAAKSDPAGRPLARFFRQPATEEGLSVWPGRFSEAGLARVRAMVGPRVWLREYDLTAEDPDAPFQPAWFEDRYEKVPRDLDTVAFLDPALSESASGCPRAMPVIGADPDGVRYVLDAWIWRGTPEQMIDKLFRVHERWHPRVIGVESNGGYALIRPLLAVWEREKRYRIPVRYVTHSRAKELRIEALCPEMESGRWRWPERPSEGVRTLEQQFLSYPNGWVDGPDAAAGCTEFLPSAWGGGRVHGAPIYHTIQPRRDLSGVL